MILCVSVCIQACRYSIKRGIKVISIFCDMLNNKDDNHTLNITRLVCTSGDAR